MRYVIFYYLNKDSIIILNIRKNIFINWEINLIQIL